MTNQPKISGNRVFVLDTSAFLAGFDPFSLSEELVTALESRKLKVKAPPQKFLDDAKVSASKIGDSFKLSETDMQLLALALELRADGYTPQIVTDDYSIQNVAAKLGIEFLALATFGINRILEWIRYCPACHKQYPINSKFKECQVCGTPLKRKPRRTVKSLKEK
jgi:endoribonuclease Nob1